MSNEQKGYPHSVALCPGECDGIPTCAPQRMSPCPMASFTFTGRQGHLIGWRCDYCGIDITDDPAAHNTLAALHIEAALRREVAG